MENNNIETFEVNIKSTDEFCTIWPDVENGLETLKTLIENPFVNKAIELVIVTGNSISNKVCNVK